MKTKTKSEVLALMTELGALNKEEMKLDKRLSCIVDKYEARFEREENRVNRKCAKLERELYRFERANDKACDEEEEPLEKRWDAVSKRRREVRKALGLGEPKRKGILKGGKKGCCKRGR